MNRIAPYIMMSLACLLLGIASSGCDILNPKPENVWHPGVVTNPSDRTLYVAITNPDPEYSEYSNQQTLTARDGSATYWLHERSKTNPYYFAVYNSDHVLVRTIKVSPDADRDDHGTWGWTVNAATGGVQFSISNPSGGYTITYPSGPDGPRIVTLN